MPSKTGLVSLVATLASLALFACGSSDGGTPPPGTPTPDGGGVTLDGNAPSSDGGAGLPDTFVPPPDGAVVPGGVRFVGRVDVSDPAAPKLAWSASGLVATVSGAKISVKLKSEGSDAFFQPVVDGKVGARFSVPNGATHTAVLADALAATDHTVELYRDSEGMYGDSVFLGFVDGTLKGAPASSGRLIEIIGDSISAGYGNLGNEVHPPWDNACGFSLDTEAAYSSYGAVLARTLGAEVSIIARSGWGVYRDLGGSTAGVLPSVYENAVGTAGAAKWDFSRKADAVVVNLGTNDSGKGDPGKPYEDAYIAFLATIRSHYPGAWIFLTFGPMTGEPMLTTMRAHVTNVVAAANAAGDSKVVAIPLDTQDATSTGCDYHPNVAEDDKMAAALAPTIKARLGW